MVSLATTSWILLKLQDMIQVTAMSAATKIAASFNSANDLKGKKTLRHSRSNEHPFFTQMGGHRKLWTHLQVHKFLLSPSMCSNPALTPEWILPVLPDASLWANNYMHVGFECDPVMQGEWMWLKVLLLFSQDTPQLTSSPFTEYIPKCKTPQLYSWLFLFHIHKAENKL